MLSALIDTNVLVSGLTSDKGSPARIVDAFKENRFNLFHCPEIVAEYHDVLSRGWLGLDTVDVHDLIELIILTGFSIMPEKSSMAMTDEDDRVFYDAAKNGGAYLVTGNIKHYPKEKFVVTATQFLMLIEG